MIEIQDLPSSLLILSKTNKTGRKILIYKILRHLMLSFNLIWLVWCPWICGTNLWAQDWRSWLPQITQGASLGSGLQGLAASDLMLICPWGHLICSLNLASETAMHWFIALHGNYFCLVCIHVIREKEGDKERGGGRGERERENQSYYFSNSQIQNVKIYFYIYIIIFLLHSSKKRPSNNATSSCFLFILKFI